MSKKQDLEQNDDAMQSAVEKESYDERVKLAQQWIDRPRRPGQLRSWRAVGRNVRLSVKKRITSDNVEIRSPSPDDLPF